MTASKVMHKMHYIIYCAYNCVVNCYMFTGTTMTEGVSVATAKGETSDLRSSSNELSNFVDEIPSLDALSFEHELCPSQSCLCHHLENNPRNNPGVSVFGVQNFASPVIAQQKPASCSNRGKDRLSLAQPVFQPPMLGCHSDADAASATNDRNCRVFGSGHDPRNSGGIQSFASLCHISDTSVVETAAAGHSPTFEQSHRGTQIQNNCKYSDSVNNII